MNAHPYANLFPMMEGEELQKLADDIRDNGLHQAIWKTEDGRILDGRNRLRACELAGVQPQFKAYKGDDEAALNFVLGLNLHRRQLNDGQRAMVAADVAKLRKGQRKTSDPQTCAPDAVTQAEAAKLLNVSTRNLQKARKVKTTASPEVVKSVERGEMSLNAAEKTTKNAVASKPADVVKAVPESVAKTDLKTTAVERWFRNKMGGGEKGRKTVQHVLQGVVQCLRMSKDRSGNPVGKVMLQDFVRVAAELAELQVVELPSETAGGAR